jgi:hypothetical protein
MQRKRPRFIGVPALDWRQTLRVRHRNAGKSYGKGALWHQNHLFANARNASASGVIRGIFTIPFPGPVDLFPTFFGFRGKTQLYNERPASERVFYFLSSETGP